MAGIDFGRLARREAESAKLVHPRDIFSALPGGAAAYAYLRGPQDQVLNQWFDRRTQTRDLIIKMNTGGGKTVVGLLIAQSSLTEGAGPVMYLTPDHHLASQVRDEADHLGIKVTDDPDSLDYTRGKAVLVTVFDKLFNGQSIFGVAGTAGRAARLSVGTVIIDDAHACVAKAEQSFRLTVPSTDPAYTTVMDLFGDVLSEQSPAGFMDLQTKRPAAVQQIPFWAWADRQPQILEALHPLSNQKPHIFTWPLLVDVLPICRAVLTVDALEVEAPCLPVGTVNGFQQAQRRIYLTATLADDSVLIADFDADAQAVRSPIVPANAGDIGDRLILVPQHTHPDASDDQIKSLIVELAADRNVAVLVPSAERAKYWFDEAAMTLDKTNITDGVEAMKSDPALGLVVFVNRYDGVDLPGEACHVLVLDGLPEALGGFERIDQAELSGSRALIARQVQRLEQGMGRATRSNEDYCVVILLGTRLAEKLNGAARSNFSPATSAQLDLSESVATELQNAPLSDLRVVIDQCLGRDPGWLAASRGRLAALRYGPATVSKIAVAGRDAFERAAGREYRDAVEILTPEVEAVTDPALQGLLRQQVASYLHHVDPIAAQHLQRQANRANRNLLRPIAGVAYEKLDVPTLSQANAASGWLQSTYPTGTDLLLSMNALAGDLMWGPRADDFEQAWSDLAWHLGLVGQRPEQDTGRGPDGLWALPGGSFIVCEAKTGAGSHDVFKKEASQLSNSMDWFRSEYPGMAVTPLLIHPHSRFDPQAAVPLGCRVMPTPKLVELRAAVVKLATELGRVS